MSSGELEPIPLAQAAASAQWYMTQPGGWYHGPVAPDRAFDLLRQNRHLFRYSDDQLRTAVERAVLNMRITGRVQMTDPDVAIGIAAGYGPFSNQTVGVRVILDCPKPGYRGGAKSVVVNATMDQPISYIIAAAQDVYLSLPDPNDSRPFPADCPPVAVVQQVILGGIEGGHEV